MLVKTFQNAQNIVTDMENLSTFWKQNGWSMTNIVGFCDRYNRGDYPGGHNGKQPTGPPGQATGPPIVIAGLDETPEWLRG